MQKAIFISTWVLMGAATWSGCDSPEPPPAPPPGPTASAADPDKERATIAAAQNSKRANAIASEIRKGHRRDILRDLGAVKAWQVSTERGGKVDEELVQTAKSGVYEKELKLAFEHRGLELKNFLRLPKAIERLRKSKPRPETCDFTCAKPVEFENIQKNLDPDVKITEDTDPSGRKRKWYQDQDVSFGVVDDHVEVVRVNVAMRKYDWQGIGAPE